MYIEKVLLERPSPRTDREVEVERDERESEGKRLVPVRMKVDVLLCSKKVGGSDISCHRCEGPGHVPNPFTLWSPCFRFSRGFLSHRFYLLKLLVITIFSFNYSFLIFLMLSF